MGSIDATDVLGLVIDQAAVVCATDPGALSGDTRFAQDLGADSLDLVEIIEHVETDLRGRGLTITLPDDVVISLGTLGDAAEAIASRAQS